MFPIELMDCLKEEFENELTGTLFLNVQEERVPINIHTQRLPIKKGEEDDAHFPFVLIKAIDGEIDSEDSAAVTSLVIVVGLIDENLNNQGHRDVLHVLDKLYKLIMEKRIFDEKYQMVFPIRFQLDEEDYYPYHFGFMETNWEVMRINREEDEFV